MKRTHRRIAAVIIYGVLATALWAAGMADEQVDGTSDLPVTDLVLFSTGVGYFQRTGTVNGTESIDLHVDASSVNDLLKSMIVQDYDGGTISSVNFASREPAIQTMQTLSVNIASNPGFIQIIGQLRGELIRIDLVDRRAISGAVVGIESSATGWLVNIMDSDGGIRSVAETDIEGFRVVDPVVRDEFRRALELMSESRFANTKRVTVRFSGEGMRRVLVGYLLSTPVWKTAYRLALGDEDEHFLQGWAIIENLTREDWENVSLTLVSGRPVSFMMDLYRPIFVSRPTLQPEIASAAASPSYESPSRDTSRVAAPAPRSEMFAMPSAAASVDEYPGASISTGRGGGAAAPDLDLSEGVQSTARGERAGEFFQYAVESPVTLLRTESAMVPIVTDSVRGERIGIYNAGSHPTHPYNSVRLENTTDLDLAAGPITLFESNTYAGDARIPILRAGEEQLISYSLDLLTTVDRRATADPERIVGSVIESGILETELLAVRSMLYTIASAQKPEKKLLVEHAVTRGFELVSPDFDEETASFYRYIVDLDSFVELTVVEERRTVRRVDLSGASNSTLESYLKVDAFSGNEKEAFRSIIERRVAMAETNRTYRLEESKRNEIYREQGRIRDNLAKLSDSESELYARYTKLLSDQEDTLEAMAVRIVMLVELERTQRESLEDFIRNLQVE